jgi:hypothetical protein
MSNHLKCVKYCVEPRFSSFFKLGRRVDIPAGAFCFPKKTRPETPLVENVKIHVISPKAVLFRTVPCDFER